MGTLSTDERLEVLTNAMRAFAEATTEYDMLLDTVVRRTAQLVGGYCGVLLVGDDGETLVPVATYDTDERALAIIRKRLAGARLRVDENRPFTEPLRTGRSVVLDDRGLQDALAHIPAPERQSFVSLRMIATLYAPLRAHGRVLGVLVLLRHGQDAKPYDQDDTLLAENLADHAALAISNARLLADLRRQVEENRKLTRALRRTEVLLDASPDAVVIVDGQGRIVFVNAQTQRAFGYPREELIGRPVEHLVPERLRAAHGAHREAFFRQPTTRPMGGSRELFALRKDGTEFPVEVSLSPIETQDGALVMSAIRDISERKRHEAQFHALLESAPDALIIVRRDGTIWILNAQAERLFGYRRDELLGRSVEILLPERFRSHLDVRAGYFETSDERTLAGGIELFGLRKDGSEFPIEISLSPIDTGEETVVAGAVRDVSERRREQQALVEASRMKSEFLANMSHELRTPLNAIIGFADLMHKGRVGPVAEEHREYLGDILTSSRHLLQLINDILDLAKVESGKMELRPQRVDLSRIVREVRDILRGLAASKRIQLAFQVDETLGEVVLDPPKLKQILYNYLSNAIKFTPEEGRVTVRVSTHGTDSFRIEVEDTGVGIAAEDLKRLFVEFQQLDTGSRKRYPGTGLGLALTRRLVEHHGGTVEVRSELGKGSIFAAVLPRVCKREEPQHAE